MLARAFVIIGGFIVLALIAALAAPLFVDWTSYRADFERQASAILGRPVTVAGKASARLIPFPSVTFADVRVGGVAGEPAMTAESFSMDAELAPFLSGNILIFDMRIDRPKVKIVVAADGSVDWTARPETTFDPAKVALEKVTIRDGEISVIHGPGVRKHVLRDLDATLSAKSLLGPIHVEGRAVFDRVEAAFALATGKPDRGNLRILFRFKPQFSGFELETDGPARLDKGRLAYSGVFLVDQTAATPLRGASGATVGGAPQRVAGGWRARGEFVADAMRVEAPKLRFETGPIEAPHIAEGEAMIDLGEAARFVVSLEGHQVTLGEAPDNKPVPLAERLAAFARALTDAPKPPIPGVVSVRFPAIVAGDTTLRDVVFKGEAAETGWSIEKLSAQLPGRTTVEAGGFLAGGQSPSFSGDLLVAIGQPSGFAAWLEQEVDEAIRRLPGAGISAKVSFNRERQALDDMEVRLGDAAFRGTASRDSAEGRVPVVSLDIEGGALDLPALQTLAAILDVNRNSDRFAGATYDLKLVAGPVSAGEGLVADKVDTALRLKDGRLEVDRLLIEGIDGVHVSATASFDGFPQALAGAVDASITGDDLAPLVSRLAARFPALPAANWLAARAEIWPDLFGDARIDLVTTLAREDAAHRHAVSAHGRFGGTDFTLSAAGDFNNGVIQRDRKTNFAFEGENPDAGALMALSGMPALPIGQAQAGRLNVEISGKPADGLTTKFALESGSDALRLDGFADATKQWTGQASLKADDLGPWMMTAGLALPGLAEGFAIDLKSPASFANGRLALPAIAGSLAGEALSGDLAWTMGNGKPKGSGRLAIGAANLPVAMRAVFGDGVVGSTGEGWSDGSFAATPSLPFTGDFALSALRVDTGWGPPLSGASMTVIVRDDGLSANDIRGDLADGRFAGFGEIRNIGGEGAIAFNGAVESVDLARLTGLAGITGKADLSVAVTGGGRTAEALAASLTGSGAATFEHLGIASVDAWAFGDILATAEAEGATITAETAEAIARKRALTGSTTFGPAETALTISGGVVRAENLRFPHAAAELEADARFDLAAESVEVASNFAYSAGDSAIVGAEPEMQFSIAGSAAAPAVTSDFQPFGRYLLQRALEREQARIEAVQAALAEKQRLRRETRHFAWLADERARLAAEEKARLEAEEAERRAAEEAALKKAEEDAAATRKAEEDAARAEQEKAAAETAARAKAEADAAAAKDKAAAKAEKPAPQPAPVKKQVKAEPETLAPGEPSVEAFPEAPKPKSKLGGLFDFLKPKAP
ncbi:MAG: AsmA family protein [Phyllobacteriaceae bacterium]|nr:AsmA family protein [Phyllobacteriaceae bacterium]